MGKPVFHSLVAADDGLAIGEVEVTAAVDISNLETYAMALGGTFVGTCSFEISFDGGTTWIEHPSMIDKTAPVVASDGGIRAQLIRGNCTAYTSGAPTFLVSGTDTDVRD